MELLKHFSKGDSLREEAEPSTGADHRRPFYCSKQLEFILQVTMRKQFRFLIRAWYGDVCILGNSCLLTVWRMDLKTRQLFSWSRNQMMWAWIYSTGGWDKREETDSRDVEKVFESTQQALVLN